MNFLFPFGAVVLKELMWQKLGTVRKVNVLSLLLVDLKELSEVAKIGHRAKSERPVVALACRFEATRS